MSHEKSELIPIASKIDKPTSNEQLPNLKYLWTAIGNGSYNRVWKSNFSNPVRLVEDEPYEGPWVLKLPISGDDPVFNAMNQATRGVRLWNEINPHLPKAGLHKSGWVAPFISNTRPASDEESAEKVVEVFRTSKRIVLDAATKGNVLTELDTNKVQLVDVDLAIKRSTSFDSINFAKKLNEHFSSYWTSYSLNKSKPITLEITRNLIFFENYLSQADIDDLIHNELLTFKNIKALTWLRTHHKKLTMDLFYNINSLTELGIEISEELFEAIAVETNFQDEEVNVTSSQLSKISKNSIFTTKYSKNEALEKNPTPISSLKSS